MIGLLSLYWVSSFVHQEKKNKRDFVFALVFIVFSVFVASLSAWWEEGESDNTFSFSYDGLKNRLECLAVGQPYLHHITIHGFLNQATGMGLLYWQLVRVDGRISKILFQLCLWRSARDEQIMKAVA